MWVYLVTNTRNGKRYVGITKGTVEARWAGHVKLARMGGTQLFMRAIRKHGPENFTLEVLEECSDYELLKARETHWIEELGTFAPAGYNSTLGGEGSIGYKHTEAARERLRDAMLGVKRGPMPESTKQKLSAAKRGRHFTVQHRAAISKASRGRKLSAECRAKIGRRQWKPVQQLTRDGTLLHTYRSLIEAEAATGVLRQNVSAVCRGRAFTAGGFIWRFADGAERA